MGDRKRKDKVLNLNPIVKALNGMANDLLEMRVRIRELQIELRDRQAALEGTERIEIPRDYIPDNAVLIEAYKTNDEIVIMHDLAFGELPPEHNCDEMGCGTLSHVWRRIPFERINQ